MEELTTHIRGSLQPALHTIKRYRSSQAHQANHRGSEEIKHTATSSRLSKEILKTPLTPKELHYRPSSGGDETRWTPEKEKRLSVLSSCF
ncbi:hypothetical protein DY000_02038389 [Brassica cretica]|uniref:Uncharacterized protein n=1 Tax=Brassica cretica TaxID=69181 RepID=A0ABQ7BJP3_BRACR|nr:hypothetical protein DY000_02038389 [Brassica cretica]